MSKKKSDKPSAKNIKGYRVFREKGLYGVTNKKGTRFEPNMDSIDKAQFIADFMNKNPNTSFEILCTALDSWYLRKIS